MGITESNSKIQNICPLDSFKLIRRYTCEAYGDVTVIQSKADPSQLFALKQFIGDNAHSSEVLASRQSLTHKNLINLKRFWHSGQQSICSNIRNVCLMFQHCRRTLEDEVQQKLQNGQQFSDSIIVKMCLDVIDCLTLLQNNGFMHVLGSMRSILVDEQKQLKIIENFQLTLYGKQKHINAMSLLTKRSIPLHPLIEPKDITEMCMNKDKIAFQNLFTLGLIGLGLCFLRQPMQLGIFNKNNYNFSKIGKRLTQIKKKYPKSYKLCRMLLTEENSQKGTYSSVVREFTELERSSFGKQNVGSLKLISIEPVEKISEKRPRNKSYYKSFKLSNVDIPNQL